ncbi:metal-dependent hydrolase [Candidatus Woesearchaeota archaeon]|nr:metal-dependent hydrolase [Candidatus Woesearchaeota archaeon]
MLAKTHLAFGFLFGLVLMPLVPVSNVIVYCALLLLFSVFPDIDTPNSFISRKIGFMSGFARFFVKHRGIFHSLLFALLFSVPVLVFWNKAYGFAIFFGYISHLIIDGFTKAGINFLHPFGNLRLQGFVETGSLVETGFFLTFIVLIIAFLI